MRADWVRWIHASLAVAMKDVAEDCDLPCLVDPLEERTEEFMEAPNSATVRISGPVDTQYGKGFHRLFVDVSVLLQGVVCGRDNAYDIFKWAGIFADALNDSIPVYNYGDEEGDYVEDDDSTLVQLGCLITRPGRPVNTFNFGQVEKDLKTKQVETNASLYIEIQE